MLIDVAFEARIWLHEPTGSWHFVTVPRDISERIRSAASGREKAFGTLGITARVGTSRWKTSLFWDRRKSAYLLPLKAAVRAKEQLRPGDTVEVLLLADLSG